MSNTCRIGVDGPVYHFSRIALRGVGQVMFQENAFTGLLFMAGIFWGAYVTHTLIVAWGALVGLVASTLTGSMGYHSLGYITFHSHSI